MVYTNTWDATFESLPPDTGENINQGADRLRDLKNAIRERLSKDHYMAIAGTDADHGEHSQITFHANVATPANLAGKSTLYAQTANSKLELWYKNDANQTVQMTSNGAVVFNSPIPANTKMLFYADTAPSGWVIQNTLDDKLVFVTKGSAAGGQTGGGVHSTGTWTQSNHTHVIPNLYLHKAITGAANVTLTHAVVGANGSDPGLLVVGQAIGGTHEYRAFDYTASSNTMGGATANTWRPAAYCFIVCEKS